jgi:tellurite resistance protein TerC
MTNSISTFFQNTFSFLPADFISTYLPVIISLIFIEVLLSIDNALVNASLAEGLTNAKERKLAIRIGILGGAALRLVALFFATLIIQNKWILIIGGIYLVYLAFDHLYIKRNDNGEESKNKKVYTFWGVVAQIVVADIIFSIDNVVSAVGLSHNYYIVVTGVLIGIISMLFVTQIISGFIHKHPIFKKAAYVIVGMIGLVILLENIFSVHIGELNKFIIIMSILVTTYVISHRRNKKASLFNI